MKRNYIMSVLLVAILAIFTMIYPKETKAELPPIYGDVRLIENETPKAAPVELVEDAPPVEVAETVIYDETEIDLLARCVHAESGNQDMTGRRLVAACVLNRVDLDYFPDTITGVITQPNQFAVASYANEADFEAVYLELEERTDNRVLWFNSGDYLPYGVALYKHGDHYFSGRGE